MEISKLYKNDINRSLNPAVSVTDNDADTVRVEIEEYVFTDEILNGLYRILDAVRGRRVSHTGIWINGYYGSGKSHFLKYLNFCLTPSYRDHALERMLTAVEEDFDPLTRPQSRLEPSLADFRDLVAWLKKAEIDTILFNIGDKVGDSTSGSTTFARALWEEFNGFRGFHKFSIPLAQYFEKPLQEKGLYEAFKDALKKDNFDWDADAETLAVTDLDYVMDVASTVASLSTDVIRGKIADDDFDCTPERLSEELSRHVANKGENYRLLFFIDEVSQFIGSRDQLLLQLQQIVTTVAKDCDKKVWVGCTAQQDLSEILDSCRIAQTSDQYGKIMGRFETRVSLQGMNTEYITRKRILEKDADGISVLGQLYDEKKNAIESQFNLPTGYGSWKDKDDFIGYYPFVPYQFRLIINVFDAFVSKGYVDTEVKGNERSVLKITHKTAQDNGGKEIGQLISFDMLFSSMFEAGLKPDGQRAIRNAVRIIDEYPDGAAFGRRVVNLLFMLCNISDNDKLLFPATLDNIVTLMMTEIDQNRLPLKEKIEKVLAYLAEKSIVRVQGREGKSDIWCFLSEEESEVNGLIRNQTPNANAVSNALKNIFTKYLPLNPRESVAGAQFSVGVSINGRDIIGQSNSAILVEFLTESNDTNVQTFAMKNDIKKMVWFLVGAYQSNRRLVNDFYWYCQVQEYLSAYASNSSEQRTRVNEEFRRRAAELFRTEIYPEFCSLLDNCPTVSGQSLIPAGLLGAKKGAERYKAAFQEHWKSVFTFASYANGKEVPQSPDALRDKILRPVLPDEYSALNPLSSAEQEIENYLNRSAGDAVFSDIVQWFGRAPYGWSEYATAYFINELVRRKLRAFSYKGNPQIDRKGVAALLLKERGSFTVTVSHQIDPSLLNDFTKAWKDIFNELGKSYSLDSSELFAQCRNDMDSPLQRVSSEYASDAVKLRSAHAEAFADEMDKMVSLAKNVFLAERDPEKFFRAVVSHKDEAKAQMDRCKSIHAFACGPQLEAFKTCYEYAKSNSDNFNFVKDVDGIGEVEELQKIFSEKDPANRLPSYNKRKQSLEKRLEEIRKNLVDNIRSVYSDVLSELEGYAASVGVAFSKSDFRNMIESKCVSNNLYALKSFAEDVEKFKEEQIIEINAKIPPAPAPKPDDPSIVTSYPNPPVVKKIRRIAPKDICKVQRITNKEELEAYITLVQQKLIDAWNGYDELQIL